MPAKVFAAIDIGSYELSMKIFEISAKNGLREVDEVRHRIALGSDTYKNKKISHERVDELCEVLTDFTTIMQSYHVEEYTAYGTSAIREIDNTMIVLDQIRNRTGIKIEVISNSEQRFLDYKAIASKGDSFQKIIEKGTAIIDIGGGSIQISLFDKDILVTTQNIRIGVLRLREKLQDLTRITGHYEDLVEEMINSQLQLFKKMHLKDRTIENIIVVDDYVSPVLTKSNCCESLTGFTNRDSYWNFLNQIADKSDYEIAKLFSIPEENGILLFHSAILIKRVLEVLGAKHIWIPGVTLSDGIAYEYAEKKKLISLEHDFEKDILACALSISKRYMGNKNRSEIVSYIATSIFDGMKKIHGLGKRERLLLRISSILNECGKYISFNNVGECSYNIIMSTEIIGLSHREREIVANIVKYNRCEFGYYNEIQKSATLDQNAYLVIAKLTAILRIATGLDRSHKQKFKDIKVMIKDKTMQIIVDTVEDITLERELLTSKELFFEEVFSIIPQIRQKNSKL